MAAFTFFAATVVIAPLAGLIAETIIYFREKKENKDV